MEFTKILNRTESKYKLIQLSKEIREEFPETDIKFELKFKGKIYKLHVIKKNWFMITPLYHVYQFKEGDKIKITKKKNYYELTVEKN